MGFLFFFLSCLKISNIDLNSLTINSYVWDEEVINLLSEREMKFTSQSPISFSD